MPGPSGARGRPISSARPGSSGALGGSRSSCPPGFEAFIDLTDEMEPGTPPPTVSDVKSDDSQEEEWECM